MAGSSESARILVVEDSREMRLALSLWLGTLFPGVELCTAVSGEEGLVAALELAPQVVLTDVRLPGMDGIEMLAALRRRAAVGVVLTAHDDQHYRRRAAAAGAFAYVLKEEAPRRLPPVLREVLAQGAVRPDGVGV